MATISRQITTTQLVEVPDCCVCYGPCAERGASEVAEILGVEKPMCLPCSTILTNLVTQMLGNGPERNPSMNMLIDTIQKQRSGS